MGTKSVVFSDLSGEQLSDDNHARVVVTMPGKSYAQALDMSLDEAAKLVGRKIDLITFTVFTPNRPAHEVQVEASALEKIFEGIDFERVLESAPRTDSARPAAPRRRASTPRSASKIDYSSPEYAGQLHRGRLTDAEIAWVQANREAASANRARQTGKPIDWQDPAEIKRYRLA